MITFHSMAPTCDLSEVAVEDAILKLRKLEGDVPAIFLMTGRLQQFYAARVIKKFQEDFDAKTFLNSGFIPPVIFMGLNPMWRKYEWLVMGEKNAVGSPGI
jgi:hypothetical protein